MVETEALLSGADTFSCMLSEMAVVFKICFQLYQLEGQSSGQFKTALPCIKCGDLHRGMKKISSHLSGFC